MYHRSSFYDKEIRAHAQQIETDIRKNKQAFSIRNIMQVKFLTITIEGVRSQMFFRRKPPIE